MSFSYDSIVKCDEHELIPTEDLLYWMDNSYYFYYSCTNCKKCGECKQNLS